MYKQLIFCYRCICVINELMTERDVQGPLYGGLSDKGFGLCGPDKELRIRLCVKTGDPEDLGFREKLVP